MKYAFILQHPEYPLTKWATLLRISRSGFHAWKNHREERTQQKKAYQALIQQIFTASKHTYGAERICIVLRKQGFTASKRKISRLMKEQQLQSVHAPRKQRSLTHSKAAIDASCPHLIENLDITRPFQLITSDLSYLTTTEGRQYICKIKEVASGTILAQTLADHMKADLVLSTIQTLLDRWHLPQGCIFHSDRGSQYRAGEVRKLLAQHGLLQSFSRKGKPGDNAWSESFFATIKKEIIHGQPRKSKEELRQALFAYTEGFYNTKRIQKRLGYLSPLEWLKQHSMGTLERVS